jgi:hypothetical protein
MAADTFKLQTGLRPTDINRKPADRRFPTNSSQVSEGTRTIGGGKPQGAYVDIARRTGGHNDANVARHRSHAACCSALADIQDYGAGCRRDGGSAGGA